MGNFNLILKSLRNTKGLTQEDLAKDLGISRSTVGMYENGSREPNYETLESIADFFNVDIDYLFGRTPKNTIVPEQYYMNNDTSEIAQFLFDNPEYKVLFEVSMKVRQEDIEFVKEMIERMTNK